MSTPASAWRGTIAFTAARPADAIVPAWMLSPRARRTKRSVKFLGRGRLPACVVRIRSELRRMNALRCEDGRQREFTTPFGSRQGRLLQTTRLYIKCALGLHVSI